MKTIAPTRKARSEKPRATRVAVRRALKSPAMMSNGVPRVQDQSERLMMPAPDCDDAGNGAFIIYIDGKPQMSDDSLGPAKGTNGAIVCAETLYRYYAGTVEIRDRVTKALVWSRS